MWKILIVFVIFAGFALWFLTRGGEIDMGGERHGFASPVVAPTPGRAIAWADCSTMCRTVARARLFAAL